MTFIIYAALNKVLQKETSQIRAMVSFIKNCVATSNSIDAL